jgi:hypothetical protein
MTPIAPFFVTGLPRSRTAWLSNLFTTGGLVCLHEGLRHGVGKLVAQIKAGEVHGNSDSSIPLHWEPLFEFFPKARWVIVERDPEEALASHVAFLEAGGLKVNPVRLRHAHREVLRQTERMLWAVPHLVVPFSGLSDIETVRRVWEHCLPDRTFDAQRATWLQRLNVQQQLSAVMAPQ